MKNVPKLRFNGFSDEWEERSLGELFDFKNGLNKEKEFFGKGTPIVNYVDVYRKNELTSDNILGLVEVTEKEKENYSVKKGDVFFTRTSETIDEIGYTAVVTEEVENTVFSGFVLRARPKTDNLSDIFCKYCFSTESARKEIVTKSSYTTRALTSGTLLSGMNVFLPKNIIEQEKIANFLTKVDKLIEKQDEKVSNLEQYKKGMMQKIFSQEIRFKKADGGEYPEWKKKHLGDIVERVVRKNKGNITKRPLTISAQYGLVDQEEFFNKVVASSNLEGYYLLNKGEFAYNKSYSNGYPFGAIKRLDRYENGAVSTLYICFIPKEHINSDYLVQYFESGMWHKEVSMVAVEGARNHGLLNISVSDFFETIHKVPCLDEQIKIAKFLSKIDSIVKKEKEKLEELRVWKKGLLQGMFI